MLPRCPSQEGSSRKRTEDQDKCPHKKGSQEDRSRQEEVIIEHIINQIKKVG